MTITVKLDREPERRLRSQLDTTGLTISEYVRIALVEKMDREAHEPSPYEQWVRLFGESEQLPDPQLPDDASERVGVLLRDKLRAKNRAR